MNVLTNRIVFSYWDFIAFHSRRRSLTRILIDRVKKNAANYDHTARQFTRKFNDCRLCSIQHFRGLLILRYTRQEWIIRNITACYHFTASLSILVTCNIYKRYGEKHLSHNAALSVYS